MRRADEIMEKNDKLTKIVKSHQMNGDSPPVAIATVNHNQGNRGHGSRLLCV